MLATMIWAGVALIVAMVMLKQRLMRKKKRAVPGPRGLPLLGNLLQMDKARPQEYLQRLAHKYGPLVSLRLGRTRILVVSSSRMAEQILKTHDRSFCSRPAVVGQQRLSYGGLDMAFSPYNHHWRRMRKTCVLHLFSAKRVLSFRAVREDEVRRMITKISNNKSLQAVNLSGMAMSLASNLICRVAFGRRYDDDEYEKIRFDRLIIEAQSLMVSFYFKDHFHAPFGVWADKASGLIGRLDNNCRELDAFYEQLINEHLDPNRTETSDPDIIDLLIQLKQNQLGGQLSWDNIKALLMNLFVAGTDTVAAIIVWTMTGLMQRPKIMNKVQAHIRRQITPNINNKAGFVNEDDMMKLPYLKAVVLEALRLYPPAPLIFRTQILPNECTVVIDGYEIEPGTSVYINGWAMGRDPERWEDPEEFRPERFMGNDHMGRDLGFEMIPFGGGRRGCPGMDMGLISVQLALANLLYSFDWALPHNHYTIDTDALPGLTMQKKTPLLLIPSPHSICNYITVM